MEKIEEYVVFKYEDEFGFHYMIMDKLPGEGPTYMEPISFGKKINPNCTPGAITRQPFSEDGKSAYVLNSKFVPWRVGGQVRETFWSGRKGPGFTEPSRNWRGKEKTSSSRKPLSLYEKHTIASVQAEGVCLLLK